MGRFIFMWLITSGVIGFFIYALNREQKKDVVWWTLKGAVALVLGGLAVGLVMVLNRL